MIILAIVFKIASLSAPNPVDKILRRKLYRLLLTIGIAEVIWFVLRYENTAFFGGHFFALLILLVGLVWLVWLLISALKNYSFDKSSWEKQQTKLKYLPK